ncbi:MAG: hypothetical protein ABIT38_15495 [Gemmatimonadaceae bacterium]
MSTAPDGRIAVTTVNARGVWRARSIIDVVTLFVEDEELVIRLSDGEELVIPHVQLTGAEWRGEMLTLHVGEESLQLTGGLQLDRTWVAIAARACSVPEMTRGLRAMGGRHGDDDELQQRFFSPLLQARRRLESTEPIDWKVSGVDATALAERLRAMLAAVAAELHPERPAYRRALEAELLDAAELLFLRLALLEDVATQLHQAPESSRFVTWRLWALTLRQIFVDADRSWVAIRRAINNVRTHSR